VPQPTIVLKPDVVTGVSVVFVGVIVSILSVDCVRVTGSVAVAVIVTVLPPGVSMGPMPPMMAVFVVVAPPVTPPVAPPVMPPGRTMVPDVLRTPVVMMAVLFPPAG